MTELVCFIVIRNVTRPVLDADEAQRAVAGLLGPLDGQPREVEPDGLGGWNVGCSPAEVATLAREGSWVVCGGVDTGSGPADYEVAAEWDR